MADNDPERDWNVESDGAPRKKGSEERPFDRWLQKQLHAMYDEIASEPLPSDLLDLIDRDAAKVAPSHQSEPNGPSGKK